MKSFKTYKPVTGVTGECPTPVTVSAPTFTPVEYPTVTTVTPVTGKESIGIEGEEEKEENNNATDNISSFSCDPRGGIYTLPVTPVTPVTLTLLTPMGCVNSNTSAGHSNGHTGHTPVTSKRRVLHLGDQADPKFGTVEEMTPAQYAEFTRANTWPQPRVPLVV